MLRGDKIAKADGKLGVLLPGMGAVTTTFIAGVESVRKGLHHPFGSLTQMGTIRLGKRTDKSVPMIKDFVPITDLSNLVFGGWDIFEEDMYAAAKNSGVLKPDDLALFMDLASRAEMSGIQEWLSFYFKSPLVAPELYPEHDLFIQQAKLKNTLRYMMEEEQITHLGIEYYEK